EARTVSFWPRLSEGRDAHHHEPRVHARQLVVTEAPLLHRAGAEVLGEDVGTLRESADQRLALRLAEIAGDRLLVARFDQPHVGDALGRLVSEAPQVVALPGLLDLDDLGAHLAEKRATERGGDEGREVERHEAVECSAHHVSMVKVWATEDHHDSSDDAAR